MPNLRKNFNIMKMKFMLLRTVALRLAFFFVCTYTDYQFVLRAAEFFRPLYSRLCELCELILMNSLFLKCSYMNFFC